jgi:hypothetical protein
MAEDLRATLIGDLVASRQHDDREQLQDVVRRVLRRVNARLHPAQRLEMTLGDEFQGAFRTPADAVEASLVLRLELLAERGGADSRYGLGWGTIEVFDASRTPISQDGPGWWAARGAIERAKEQAARPRGSYVRTVFASHEPTAWIPSMDAFLLMRDATVGRMPPRQRRLLAGLLSHKTQAELAEQEGITQGAVSQALNRGGGLAIVAAHDRLREEQRR